MATGMAGELGGGSKDATMAGSGEPAIVFAHQATAGCVACVESRGGGQPESSPGPRAPVRGLKAFGTGYWPRAK
jgi:hypothetical protein